MFESYFTAYEHFLSLSNLQLKAYSDSKVELQHSLERTEAFLEHLGAPQEKLKFVHVTGTSGKGSVCNYLHNILRTDKRSVATYSSPHTSSFLERFRVNDKLISPKKLQEYMHDIIRAYKDFLLLNKGTLSFFELSVCLALYAFEREGAEWCVLEVGCGGRYDATNIIPPPAVAVITNVDKDHTELLGNSLTKIAYEKAGIIKRGSTVFCGELRPSLKDIFKKEAIKHHAALFFMAPNADRFVDIDLGPHQQRNAQLASAAAEELGIPAATIKRALERTKLLPCRFETIQKKPLIILDGAHSPAKMQATAEQIKDLFGKAHIIFGAKAGKDSASMLEILAPVAKTITTTRFTSTFHKAENPATLFEGLPKQLKNDYFLDPFQAIHHVKKQAQPNEAIVVTGSLYLAGEVRKLWINEEEILKNQDSTPHD